MRCWHTCRSRCRARTWSAVPGFCSRKGNTLRPRSQRLGHQPQSTVRVCLGNSSQRPLWHPL
ncbi:unnamed protein product, partial [Gulo gulo]